MRGVLNSCGEAVVQDSGTYLVHMGRVYGFYVEDTDLDTAESYDVLISVGNTELHIVFDLQVFGGQVVAYIYEDVITTDDGTEVRTSRFNRTLPKNLKTKIYSGPTVSDPGSVFVTRRVLAHAQGNAGITSAVQSGLERVFKPNTKYLLRVTSAADNVSMTLTGVMKE